MTVKDFKTNITKIDNGMRIITCPTSHTETTSISIWADVGSRYETIENNGISHFLEHMAFKGTTNRNAKQIAEEFDSIGGLVNASTSREHTSYYAKTLKEDFETGAEILSDILLNSTFDQQEMERERQVILQELAMTNDTPDDIVFDYYQQTAFPNQSLGRSILGTTNNIMNISKYDLRKYMEEHYTPERIVVSVGGNIEHKKVVDFFSKRFENLKNNKSIKKEKPTYTGGVFRKEKDLEQTHLVIGFEGLSYHDADIYKIQILSGILGGGFSSRLFQEIREKRGLAYSISAHTTSYSDTGLFTIYTGVDPANVRECLNVLDEELKKAAGTITEEELERAKKQAIAPLIMGIESSSFRAEDSARNYICLNRQIPILETINKVKNITLLDIQCCLKNILSKTPTLAAIGNLNQLPRDEKLLEPLARMH